MIVVFMSSIAARTAVAAQFPSAIRMAFACISRLDSPTAPGPTALCNALSASSSETSAPVLGSVVVPLRRAPTRSARTDPS